jgi:mannose-6-phosphate isomerase
VVFRQAEPSDGTQAGDGRPAPYESEQRPWGSWHVIDVSDGYKVKRIHVTPGRRLSYQTHTYRSEHWVVIFGVATCTIDDEVMVVGPGESVDVAQGAKHRLANEGSEELVIVEVQRGAYTGEDDIVRLEDDFGRLETP